MSSKPAPRALAAALAVAVSLPLAATPAAAWYTVGHRRVTMAAVRLLPEAVPAFFRAGGAMVGHLSVDPDFWKARETPALRDRESPEHFIDLERLDGFALPPTRGEYLRLLSSLRREPGEAGALPYAVVEGTERLELCFAEHRRWPDNPYIREKCLMVAGVLAHYAGDLEQPLHTTVHHDGWAEPDGRSPATGFHFLVDPLFESSPFDAESAVEGVAPRAFPEIWPAVSAELAAAHGLIDRLYALEPDLAAPGGIARPAVLDFACERYRATAAFLASLYLTAWEKSVTVRLPSWLQRESGELEPAR
ncbi:MAG: hypothetical protein U0X73_09105 [Thermoanaerobaculia bacterium]